MNKDEIISEVAKLLDTMSGIGSFTVVYGAAMVIHGIKESCNDIDVTVGDEEFEKLVELGFEAKQYSPKKGHLYIKYNDKIDVFKGEVGCATKIRSQDLGMAAGIKGWKPTAYPLVRVQTITSLIDEKKARGRKKDLEDLKLINEYIRDGSFGLGLTKSRLIDILKILDERGIEPSEYCITGVGAMLMNEVIDEVTDIIVQVRMLPEAYDRFISGMKELSKDSKIGPGDFPFTAFDHSVVALDYHVCVKVGDDATYSDTWNIDGYNVDTFLGMILDFVDELDDADEDDEDSQIMAIYFMKLNDYINNRLRPEKKEMK